MIKRICVFAYGATVYVAFLGVFLYLAGFLGNLVVPKSIDSAPAGPLGQALLIDGLLVLLFGLQHSVMARPGFKRWWTRVVPAPIERSTYVLITNVILLLTYWQWQTIPITIWEVTSPAGVAALWTVFGIGWGLVLVSTFVIDHFDLFGLKQVFNYLRGRAHSHPRFKVSLFYRWVRHPLYVGWLTTFWATPHMTGGHLLFAVGMTAYILIAIQVEERDLVAFHGRDYEDYRATVPMLVPVKGRAYRDQSPRDEELTTAM